LDSSLFSVLPIMPFTSHLQPAAYSV
jgi:hypothetical protein